jgi:hypothetical protein
MLKEIRLDGDTQPRVEMSKALVEEYAQEMAEGAIFPPVAVIFNGTDYWLYDGFHRYHAAKELGRERIAAQVKRGKRRDAVWESLGANKAHGLRRQNKDKVKAVLKALQIRGNLTDANIAEHVGVSHMMVRKYRSARPATLNGLKLDGTSLTGTDRTLNGLKLDEASLTGPDRTLNGLKLGSQPGRLLGRNGKWYTPRQKPVVAADRRQDQREQRLYGKMVADRPDRDALGRELAGPYRGRLHTVFSFRPRLVEEINRLMELGRYVGEAAAKRNGVFRQLNLEDFRGQLRRLIGLLMHICPHSMCVRCQGAGCNYCRRRGWVDDWTWRMDRPRSAVGALPDRVVAVAGAAAQGKASPPAEAAMMAPSKPVPAAAAAQTVPAAKEATGVGEPETPGQELSAGASQSPSAGAIS